MNASAVETAKRLLKSAAKAVDDLEDAVRELVAMRAWEVLGYANFSEMWLAENGYECPTQVQVLAVRELADEGLNTNLGRALVKHGQNGHTTADIAKSVGLNLETRQDTGYQSSSMVSSIMNQLDHGVPADKVAKGGGRGVRNNIHKYGSPDAQPKYRSRGHSRRTGAGPTDLVTESVSVMRRDADAIEQIAREADVPKAEIYRQAVAEYLMRHAAAKAAR